MEAKKALITGIAGFVGSHLAELLLKIPVEAIIPRDDYRQIRQFQ